VPKSVSTMSVSIVTEGFDEFQLAKVPIKYLPYTSTCFARIRSIFSGKPYFLRREDCPYANVPILFSEVRED